MKAVAVTELERALDPLVAEGILLLGLPQDSRAYRRSRVKIRGSTRELLDAEREER
jgi:hypothetical protein